MIFNRKTANSARAREVFKLDHILKLEGYKVQVVQASPQRLFVLPPCNNPAGDTSRRISAAEEEEHHLQFEAWETRPEGACEKASRRGARRGAAPAPSARNASARRSPGDAAGWRGPDASLSGPQRPRRPLRQESRPSFRARGRYCLGGGPRGRIPSRRRGGG